MSVSKGVYQRAYQEYILRGEGRELYLVHRAL